MRTIPSIVIFFSAIALKNEEADEQKQQCQGQDLDEVTLVTVDTYRQTLNVYTDESIDASSLPKHEKVITKAFLGKNMKGDIVVVYDNTLKFTDFQAYGARTALKWLMQGKTTELATLAIDSQHRTVASILDKTHGKVTAKTCQYIRDVQIDSIGEHTLLGVDGMLVEGIKDGELIGGFEKNVPTYFGRGMLFEDYDDTTRLLRPINGFRSNVYSQGQQYVTDFDGKMVKGEVNGAMIMSALPNKTIDVDKAPAFNVLQRDGNQVSVQRRLDFEHIAPLFGANSGDLRQRFEQEAIPAK